MTTSTTTITTAITTAPTSRALADDRPRLPAIPAWVLAGATLIGLVLTGARWNIPALAWLAPVPLLLLARRLATWRQWLALAGLLAVGLSLQVLKIVTDPVPPVMALAFAVPAAVSLTAIVAITEWIRRRAGEHAGVVAFASLSALGDVAAYRLTELGSWMTGSTTQASSLLVMQLAAVAGLWGIGLVMAWTAGVLASLLARGPRARMGAHAIGLAAVLLIALGWATARLERAQADSLTVAAVTTDVGLGRDGLPDAATLARNVDELFARSEQAAARGARVIAWPEVASVVQPEDEPALVERARVFATRHRVDLALAYGVLRSSSPLLLDNKVSLVTSEGTIAQTYRKHHPVPGEPSIRGDEPIEVIERPYGKVALAICYDFDFPALARAQARLGAQLVIVPASDWEGIDPVHAEMARGRAIEGGFSLLRPVRWASSAAFDGVGRVRGWLPGRESGKVLVANVPLEQLSTPYTRLGDAPALALVLPLAGSLGLAIRRRRRRAESR